jgi:hypothetical protein
MSPPASVQQRPIGEAAYFVTRSSGNFLTAVLTHVFMNKQFRIGINAIRRRQPTGHGHFSIIDKLALPHREVVRTEIRFSTIYVLIRSFRNLPTGVMMPSIKMEMRSITC